MLPGNCIQIITHQSTSFLIQTRLKEFKNQILMFSSLNKNIKWKNWEHWDLNKLVRLVDYRQ